MMGISSEGVTVMRWSKERIWDWYNARPWMRGCNYMSADCANRVDQWQELGFEERFRTTEEELKLGHGGMDFILFRTFVDCLLEDREMPIDVYDAAAWMSVSVLAAESIEKGGAPVAIPDFTEGKWTVRKSCDVLPLPNPEN